MNKKSKFLVITGFHRSGTSAAANYLSKAGLAMGSNLMPGSISNPKGHFEDLSVVKLHDELLTAQSTDWQFHNEVELKDAMADARIKQYFSSVSDKSLMCGFKDPRASLFLPAWHRVGEGKVRFLFLFRHWSECVESLLNRHSRSIAHDLSNHRKDLNFWVDPFLAYKMWYSYNKKILDFINMYPQVSILVSQRSISDQTYIDVINSRFDFNLDSGSSDDHRIYDYGFSDEQLNANLSRSFFHKLESLWFQLLERAHCISQDESIKFARIEKKIIDYEVLNPAVESTQLIDYVAQKEQELYSLITRYIDELSFDKAIQKNCLDYEVTIEKVKWSLQSLDILSHQLYQDFGAFFMKHGHLDVSRLCYEKAIVILGRKAHLFFALGNVESADYNFKKAIYFYDLAIQINPSNIHFYLAKSRLLSTVGEFDLAVQSADQAISVQPDNVAAQVFLAALYEKCGKFDQALEILERENLSGASSYSNIQRAQVRLKIAMSTADSDDFYSRSVQAKLAQSNASGYLNDILCHVDSGAAEQDLLRRIYEHWEGVGFSSPVLKAL